jgi:hypothetical protein
VTVAAAAWCVTCGAQPDVAVTVERRGTMMHYGACWQHVTTVAERARLDVARIDRNDADRRAVERFAAGRRAAAGLAGEELLDDNTRITRQTRELEP